MVIPLQIVCYDYAKNLALLTQSMFLLLTFIGSKSLLDRVKLIRSSLHLSSFSRNLSADTCWDRSSTYCWILLVRFFNTVSAMVVSSTYFHIGTPLIERSLIMMVNSHGPNLVPWGTPDGITPHSE